MKRIYLVTLLVILSIALIAALVVNYYSGKERKSQKLEQLQSDVKDIERTRDEAYSRVGKDPNKTEAIDIISEELIRQKKEKMKSYEEK